MRLTRILPLLLVFTFLANAARTDVLEETHMVNPRAPGDAHLMKADVIHTSGRKVSILLHGLMVGRIKEGKTFEVGIVRRALDHQFHFTVSGNEICSHTPVLEEIHIDTKTTCRFVLKKRGVDESPNIRLWHPGMSTCVAPESDDVLHDSKYLFNLNMDTLHGGGVDRYKKPFNRIFYLQHGYVKTKCATRPISARKVENEVVTEQPLGRLAEVVEVEICLDNEESLTLMNETTNEPLWEHTYCATGQAEANLVNLPPELIGSHSLDIGPCCICPPDVTGTKKDKLEELLNDYPKKSPTRLPDETEERATHFQLYYYLVFKKDRPDRFELEGPSDCLFYEYRTPEGNVCPRGVPPYRCGMALVNKDLGKVAQ